MTTIIALSAGLVILTGVIIILLLKNFSKTRKEKQKGYLFNLSGSAEASPRVLNDVSISSDEYDELMERLVGLFETEKMCLKPNVRIVDIASSLAVGKGTLSRAIKMKTGKNFCQLIHHYRVREAMRIYANHPNMTVSEISKRVGFNSQTTFITAFGRHTGYTPAEWCRQYKHRKINGGYGVKKRKKA